MVNNIVQFLKGLKSYELSLVAKGFGLDPNANRNVTLNSLYSHLLTNPDEVSKVPDYTSMCEADDHMALEKAMRPKSPLSLPIPTATEQFSPSPTVDPITRQLVEIQLQQQQLLARLAITTPKNNGFDDRFHKRSMSLSKLWDGDKSEGFEICDFLASLEELRRQYNADDSSTLSAIRDILKGKARTWFLANRQFFNTYQEFKEELLAVFLPFDHQRKISNRIRNEKQRHESMDVFLARLENLNQVLSPTSRFRHEEILEFAISNADPLYTVQLNLLPVKTKPEVLKIARILEHARAYEQQFSKPRSSTYHSTPRVAACSSEESSFTSQESNEEQTETKCAAAAFARTMEQLVCYKCRQKGHFSKDCPSRLPTSPSDLLRRKTTTMGTQTEAPRSNYFPAAGN